MTLVQLLKLSVTKFENVMGMATLSELHAAEARGPGAVRRVPSADPIVAARQRCDQEQAGRNEGVAVWLAAATAVRGADGSHQRRERVGGDQGAHRG